MTAETRYCEMHKPFRGILINLDTSRPIEIYSVFKPRHTSTTFGELEILRPNKGKIIEPKIKHYEYSSGANNPGQYRYPPTNVQIWYEGNEIGPKPSYVGERQMLRFEGRKPEPTHIHAYIRPVLEESLKGLIEQAVIKESQLSDEEMDIVKQKQAIADRLTFSLPTVILSDGGVRTEEDLTIDWEGARIGEDRVVSDGIWKGDFPKMYRAQIDDHTARLETLIPLEIEGQLLIFGFEISANNFALLWDRILKEAREKTLNEVTIRKYVRSYLRAEDPNNIFIPPDDL